MLPFHIAERLKRAGDAARAIREGSDRGTDRLSYQDWIAEIDRATAEARRLMPELYRQETEARP